MVKESLNPTKHRALSMVAMVSVVVLLLLANASLYTNNILLPGNVLAQSSLSPPPGAPGSQLASLGDKWWQWILSIDTSTQPNPFTTVYQGDCRQLLQGNTMFLVGQFPPGSVSNHGVCNVSAQTAVLFPVINFVYIDCTSKQQQSPNKPPGFCAFDITTPAKGQPFKQLRDIVFDCTVNPGCVDHATNLAASIDGVPLQFADNRVQSPPGGFEVRLAPNDPFGTTIGPVTLHGVSDGYWVLIPSLPPGQHTLTFGGCLPTLGCQTNTYTLIVS